MCDSAVRSSPGGRGAYPLKCKQPLVLPKFVLQMCKQ